MIPKHCHYWSFFENYIVEENNYLITDNYQEDRIEKVVNRTSSTNIGLELLAIISAYDLGFINFKKTIDYLNKVLVTISGLSKWNGHLYNWYNIKTLMPLLPRYISTVDSGNFVGYLFVVKTFLLENKNKADLENMINLVTELINCTDFSKLYSNKNKLLSIGYNLEENKLTDSYYDFLELKKENRPYDIIEGIPVKVRLSEGSYVNINNNKESEIAVVSDLHLGSIYDRTDLIRRVYKDCLQRGVSTILCAGDVTDGYYPERKRYCKSQKVAGFEETLDYAFRNLPHIGDIKMYAISGNHDDTFETGKSKSILAELSRRREDFIYLGKDGANFEIGGAKIKMLHGFSKYDSMDKRLEDLYDSTSVLTRPDLLILGHIHTSFYKKI